LVKRLEAVLWPVGNRVLYRAVFWVVNPLEAPPSATVDVTTLRETKLVFSTHDASF
jgi:hypothetical protein